MFDCYTGERALGIWLVVIRAATKCPLLHITVLPKVELICLKWKKISRDIFSGFKWEKWDPERWNGTLDVTQKVTESLVFKPPDYSALNSTDCRQHFLSYSSHWFSVSWVPGYVLLSWPFSIPSNAHFQRSLAIPRHIFVYIENTVCKVV